MDRSDLLTKLEASRKEKLGMMSPDRKKAHVEYDDLKFAKEFGERAARIKKCERDYETNQKLHTDNLWTDRTWQSEGGVLLKNDNYRQWILDG